MNGNWRKRNEPKIYIMYEGKTGSSLLVKRKKKREKNLRETHESGRKKREEKVVKRYSFTSDKKTMRKSIGWSTEVS